MLSLTRHELGLILVFAGTVCLAYSVRADTQYDKDVLSHLKRAHKNLFVPTETKIIPLLFRGGLALIALGTACQW
jgi:hypothetical protein